MMEKGYQPAFLTPGVLQIGLISFLYTQLHRFQLAAQW